jgi:plasmid stability protein
MSNLTLSIDDDLLKQARLYAVQHDTSVNAMVRDYLKSVVTQVADQAAEQRRAERLKAVENIQRITELIRQENMIPEGVTWKREDAYADREERWNR